MEKIGVREAKIHLSRLIDDVLEGKEIIITNHNRPVAVLSPIKSEFLSLEERIERLERQGIIEPIDQKSIKPFPPPIPLPKGLAQKFLQEDRNG
ncbi:MAG: type II toxin-antitoxin system prevent-host-death family antitoxin [Acidobacteriota bacterium]